ncbi:MotA/TolQ/ExbB proton channel family protein [Paraburkholderia sp.]|uniref:MotA/TolQ/ExbB proton channel family protein n=1 Tax=Paraburkholderia sp. TaxID=1926495 RepID=UPI0023966F57|nr:MotA/TolQ/ExbB proton channel family protein [Paraburkholderia sp.]MDE1181866.1 MotA/TolQ/ExbB proton channel family protein [Paraburkholderia sp.]
MLNTLITWSIESYGLLPLMAVILLIALAVIIERLSFHGRVTRAGDALQRQLQRAQYQNMSALSDVASQYQGTLQVELFEPALKLRPIDAETLDRHIEESILTIMPKMTRNLWLIDTTVTLAPLLGLLGTIIGMMQSFDVLSTSAKGNPTAVTGGIAHALVATAFGLAIAIIAVVFLNFFNTRNRLLLNQMEVIKTMLINRIFGGALQTTSSANPTGASKPEAPAGAEWSAHAEVRHG